jgi:hypothetical protein
MPGVQIEDSIIALALHNDLAPLAKDIEGVLASFSNRDYIRLDEKHINLHSQVRNGIFGN